jgi:hypothetical protein
LRGSFQKLLLKRTTAGRSILSTTSLTLFEVLLSMLVLQAGHVLFMRNISQISEGIEKGISSDPGAAGKAAPFLLQSSTGRAPRAAAKASSAASNAGCVVRA